MITSGQRFTATALASLFVVSAGIKGGPVMGLTFGLMIYFVCRWVFDVYNEALRDDEYHRPH